MTRTRLQKNLEQISIVWTSDASSGEVWGNAFSVGAGALWQVKFIPGVGMAQPTNSYDVTIEDEDGCDVVVGKGANLSNVTSYIGVQNAPLSWLTGQDLDVVVSAAGNSKQGTVVLVIARMP